MINNTIIYKILLFVFAALFSFSFASASGNDNTKNHDSHHNIIAHKDCTSCVKIQKAKQMLDQGKPIADIAKETGLSEEKIKSLK